MKKMTITYSDSILATKFSDFNIIKQAKDIVDRFNGDNVNVTIETSTSNIIIAIRVMVKKGLLDHNKVSIVANGKAVPLDKNGTISEGNTFLDWLDECLDTLLGYND
jgi:hypothetical protein